MEQVESQLGRETRKDKTGEGRGSDDLRGERSSGMSREDATIQQTSLAGKLVSGKLELNWKQSGLWLSL